MSEAEKRRKDRQELEELMKAIEPAKNEDIARRAISIADYWLIKAENQAKHIQDLEARNSKQPTIEPERKRGRWLEKKVVHAINDGCITEWQSCKCSECGRYDTRPYMYYFDEPNFCSYCGAEMQEEES